MTKIFLFLIIVLSLSACVTGPEVILQEPLPVRAAGAAAPPSLQSQEGLHFVVRGHDPRLIQAVSKISEEIYTKIMFDTNLLSFKPKQNYNLTVYKNQEEYHEETGYPLWSGGGAITQPAGRMLPSERETRARTAIFTFEEALSPPLLAHEICHLVFNEFMDYTTAEEMQAHRWLNEGLATFEELEAYPAAERDEFLNLRNSLLKRHALPLSQAVKINLFNESVRAVDTYSWRGASQLLTNVDIWYWQAGSVVKFLIEKKGQYNFYLLMSALKRRKDIDAALEDAYPGGWRTWSDVEEEWKAAL